MFDLHRNLFLKTRILLRLRRVLSLEGKADYAEAQLAAAVAMLGPFPESSLPLPKRVEQRILAQPVLRLAQFFCQGFHQGLGWIRFFELWRAPSKSLPGSNSHHDLINFCRHSIINQIKVSMISLLTYLPPLGICFTPVTCKATFMEIGGENSRRFLNLINVACDLPFIKVKYSL